MRTMEFSGRTVDEAIFAGLSEMGVSIDEVEIETLQSESKGIFGLGARNAVVRLTERETAVEPDFESMKSSAPSQRGDRPRSDRGQGRSFSRGGRDGGSRSSGRDSGRSRYRDDDDEQDRTRSEPLPTFDYTRELAESTEAGKFLTELLSNMHINGTVLAVETDDGLRLNIESDSDGLLIGRRGETLDALQYIVSLHVNRGRKESGYQRITIDTENYRLRREETLRRLAKKNASRAVRTGRPVAMEPMNPYERRVLHSALQGFRGVETHSEGEEPNRRVIITPTR